MNLIKSFIAKRYWVYLFPWLMDFSLAAFLLFAAVRAAQLGASPLIIGLLGSTWGVTYTLSSLILSRYAHQSRANFLMTTGCLAFIMITIILAFFNSLPVLFILMPVCGMFNSAFFVGFQLFMGESTGMTPAESAAVYTIAWSSGFAFGSLAEGYLIEMGTVASLAPMICSSAAVIAGICLLGYLDSRREQPAMLNKVNEPHHTDETESKSSAGISVAIGWISIFTVALIGSGLRFLLPKVAITFFNQPAAVAGGLVFVLLLIQAISGIAFLRFPGSTCNLSSHALAKFLAVTGCLSALSFSHVWGLLVLVLLVGAYSGHAYYKGVFYSLNDWERSGRNVSINEALVGMAGIIGPTLSGAALGAGLKLFFLCPVIILAAALLLQLATAKYFR